MCYSDLATGRGSKFGSVNTYSNSTFHFLLGRLGSQSMIVQSIVQEPALHPTPARCSPGGDRAAGGPVGRSDCDLSGPSLPGSVMLRGSCWPSMPVPGTLPPGVTTAEAAVSGAVGVGRPRRERTGYWSSRDGEPAGPGREGRWAGDGEGREWGRPPQSRSPPRLTASSLDPRSSKSPRGVSSRSRGSYPRAGGNTHLVPVAFS